MNVSISAFFLLLLLPLLSHLLFLGSMCVRPPAARTHSHLSCSLSLSLRRGPGKPCRANIHFYFVVHKLPSAPWLNQHANPVAFALSRLTLGLPPVCSSYPSTCTRLSGRRCWQVPTCRCPCKSAQTALLYQGSSCFFCTPNSKKTR